LDMRRTLASLAPFIMIVPLGSGLNNIVVGC
jgi:hypothetical protein